MQNYSGFKSMIPTVREFTVLGETVKARTLRFRDYSELQDMLGNFEINDIGDLLNRHPFKAYPGIIWLASREHTPEFAEFEAVAETIGFDNLREWNKVINHAVGIELTTVDDDADTAPDTATQGGDPKNE